MDAANHPSPESIPALPEPHVLDQALRLERLSPEGEIGALRWGARTAAPYANMVGPFGGMTAAQVLHAVRAHPALLGEPITSPSPRPRSRSSHQPCWPGAGGGRRRF